jgi:hypothetical protein
VLKQREKFMELKKLLETKKRKRKYIKPEIQTEEIYETLALSCGKCDSGPYILFECYALPQTS